MYIPEFAVGVIAGFVLGIAVVVLLAISINKNNKKQEITCMDFNKITLDECMKFHEGRGVEFVIEDGSITCIIRGDLHDNDAYRNGN